MARVPEINRARQVSQVAAAAPRQGVGFEALSQIAGMAADFIKPAALKQSAEEGANAVYRDEHGKLRIDEKNVLGGEMAGAHNQAAYSKYLSTRKMDIRATMQELQIKHEFDPAGFKDASDAYMKLMQEDETAPALLREDLSATVQNEALTRFNGLQVQQINRTQRESDRDTSTHRDMLADDYVNLTMAGDTEGAARVYAEMQSVTSFRASAPYIGETPNEAEAYLSGARGAARAAQITQELSSLEGASSITDERRAEIQGLVDNPDLSPAVRQRLYAATKGVLKGIDGRGIADSLAGTDVSSAVRNFDWAQHRSGGGLRGDAISGMDTDFRGSLEGMIASAPESIRSGLSVFSGFRSVEKQQELWDAALVKYGSAEAARKWVAPPGNSQHGHGNAADLSWNGQRLDKAPQEVKDWVHANAGNFGLAFPLDNEAWHIEAAGARGGPAAPRVDFNANRAKLDEMGVPVSPGSEFFAAVADTDTAALIFSVDPTVIAGPLLPPEVIAANPMLENMTVGQVRSWAERKGTVKAADIAARRTQIDQIEDTEVRDIALSALNDHYQQRKRMEDAAAMDYQSRVEYNDSTLTEQQIADDHSLSDQSQRSLISDLQAQRKDAREIQETLSTLADDGALIDPYDSGTRKKVDDAYTSLLNGESPMSQAGMVTAGQIVQRSGIVPRPMFNALRSAANGNDPASLAVAMEFAGQALQMQPNAFGPMDGGSDVLSNLSDYKFYSGMMGGEEAAARIIENRNSEAPKNVTDQAKDLAKNLKPEQVTDFMAGRGADVTMGSPAQQAAIMGDYDRLFREAYAKTGDEGLSRNRALEDMARVYGPNGVTGDKRIMRFPPQQFYPQVVGKPDWMRDQITAEVNAFAGIDVGSDPFLSPGSAKPISSDRIIINSDERTRGDVAAGRSPTYGVSYLDGDDMLQSVPGRFAFAAPTAEAADIATMESQRSRESGVVNLRLWREYLRANGQSEGQAMQAVLDNKAEYSAAPPPTE
jgi:hypothetical protein